MLKRKICKLLAAIMVTTTVLSGNVQVARAAELSTIETVENKKIADGVYEVNNTTEYIEPGNITGEDMARKALKEQTIIKVENGKITMTLKFGDSLYNFMKNIKVSLDGQDLNGVNNAEDKSITFEVPSVDAKVQVDMTISIMGRAVTFFVSNDTTSLPVVDEEDKVETPDIVLDDGKYTAINNTRYITDSEHGNNSARAALETETLIEVKDGRTFLTLTFSSMFSMYENITVSLDDKELNANLDDSKRSITFEVPSADTEVLIGMNIKGMNHKVAFYVRNDANTIEKIEDNEEAAPEVPEEKPEEKPEVPDNNGGNTGDNSSDNGSSNGGSTEIQGTKVYTVQNTVSHESSIGQEMARKYLNATSRFEEINGKYYVTLTFTGTEFMQSHEVYVNSKKVNVNKTVNGDETKVKFEVGSIEDSLKVSTYVVPMGRNVEFTVNLLKDTLTLVSVSDEENNNENSSGSNDTNNGESSSNNSNQSNSGTNTGNSQVEEVVKGKLYSIQNNVIHESETGRSMARKYLNTTSKVEEIEGTYYITLTFTGSEFMQNHEIYVNGAKVSATKNTSGDETYVRFAVSSLSDTIKVKTYVVPMSREVEFEVDLLQDTLTFIKEYTVEKLPNTGAATGAGVVAGLGLMMTSAGTVLLKKKR